MTGAAGARGETWVAMLALFLMATLLKLLVLAPGLYRSTDFEVHRNWLAITHSRPLKDWYWEDTSEWTLDYPPLFAYFQWALSQAAVRMEPDLVKITPYYEPSEAAVWFQRASVLLTDATLVLGVLAWSKEGAGVTRGAHGGRLAPRGATPATHLGSLVLLNAGLFMVDHVHFQYNGFLLGLLLLSMGLVRQGRTLSGGATFACLLMLKHLFLALAPLYFVYLLRSYCCRRVCHQSAAAAETQNQGGQKAAASWGLSWKRLTALGAVVLAVFGTALVPLCVSDGWTRETCSRQMRQLGARLFPFGRGLVHAYWAPNLWAVYLFLDRVFLTALKAAGLVAESAGKGSTTGGLVRPEVMAVLPPVPAAACLALSVLACCPALVRAWKSPSPRVFAWGVVHCSLSAFLVGFHVHEKALLVPAVASALLALDSGAGARMHLRVSFLAAFAAFPLLPGPELRVLKVTLLIGYLVLATSLLEYRHHLATEPPIRAASPAKSRRRGSVGDATTPSTPRLWTAGDKAYVAGAGIVWALGELVHPWALGEGMLPFLPLMGMSVYGAVGVAVCWGLSAAALSAAVYHGQGAP